MKCSTDSPQTPKNPLDRSREFSGKVFEILAAKRIIVVEKQREEKEAVAMT
ncbi:MAG: hypothetical protein AAFO83_00040 [Cyanobacteria bacterium J06607_13]